MDDETEITEMGSRDFQLAYQRLTEPVKVVAKNANERRVIGFFFPGPVDPRIQPGEWPVEKQHGK